MRRADGLHTVLQPGVHDQAHGQLDPMGTNVRATQMTAVTVEALGEITPLARTLPYHFLQAKIVEIGCEARLQVIRHQKCRRISLLWSANPSTSGQLTVKIHKLA
ncbi:protein of unknown function [Kyrpidia spormannii]|uniref:Uncharacterized protein n=2 Tax=Kyrpidia spormannii TaxID=2055160 RepID=A0ACA8Z7R9_9BACL|nr:protein of unknown function [Kyrpidia spormannii]CAB3392165.1 protein of unknown function [Kyrpidia spormannii]